MRSRYALALLLVLGALAAAARSAASSPRPSDRSIKLDLIARLHRGPQILILGDSRGRQAEPSYLQRLTGETGFNAAVMGGTAPEAWVFIRYVADRFPGQKRRYIWFVSPGLAGNVVDPRTKADPRGRRYLQEIAPYLSHQPDNPPWPIRPFTGYRPDGGLRAKAWPPSASHVRKVKAEAAAMVADIQKHPPVASAIDPNRSELFEHLLAYLNARGERPVIVFNPVYPTIYAALRRDGNPVTRSSLAYLNRIRSRYDFVVVNCEDVRTWGGNDSDWKNPGHVDRINMNRMLRYIVAHADRALG
jgi:hypothetical protein